MKKQLSKLFLLVFLVLGLVSSGCDSDDDDGNGGNSDIPADPGGNAPTVTIANLNTLIPNVSFAALSGNNSRIQINMAGIIDPKTGNPIEFTPNGTFFVTEDGVLQGIKITKAGGGTTLKADIVFTVDNSGSMGGEADSVASKIVQFVNYLTANGLDLKVGVVGYNGDVTGAINFTTATDVKNYLTRPGYTGTSRTVGFAGPDATALQTAASTYASGIYGENGIVGITFADSLFAWRSGSQRVYVNFTDEPTQPDGVSWFSSAGFCKRWAGRGTVHTVWSGGDTTNYSWTPLYDENPADLSTCTGGTFKSVAYDASDLDLTTLPVTGSLAASALVEFLTSNPNGPHTIKLTVTNGQTGAGASDGEKTFTGVTYK